MQECNQKTGNGANCECIGETKHQKWSKRRKTKHSLSVILTWTVYWKSSPHLFQCSCTSHSIVCTLHTNSAYVQSNESKSIHILFIVYAIASPFSWTIQNDEEKRFQTFRQMISIMWIHFHSTTLQKRDKIIGNWNNNAMPMTLDRNVESCLKYGWPYVLCIYCLYWLCVCVCVWLCHIFRAIKAINR